MKARANDARFRPIDNPPSITQGMTARLGLVIPCFREIRRLPAFLPGLLSAMENAALPVVVQIVDDGSGQSEADALDAFLAPLRAAHPLMLRPMLRLPANIGKGGTVYAGWDALAPQCTHLAFVDADGAIPADETARLLAMAAAGPSGTAIFASRAGSALVERQWLRQCAGLAFRALVHLLIRLPVRDTQCGLKIIPADIYQTVRPRLARRDFAFDIELAMALRDAGCAIHEVPVRWKEQPGSHLRPGHGLTMFAAVAALWWRGLTLRPGSYSPSRRG